MKTAILHYSAAPVVGGVEAVIQAHTKLLLGAGYPVTVIAGAGDQNALPAGAKFVCLPEMDSLHPTITRISRELEAGNLPGGFDDLAKNLARSLEPVLRDMDHVIVHNIFTKHFNLPLTAALVALLNASKIRHCIAWCHDFSWTSPHSRKLLHPGQPWDLLRTYRQEVSYVTVSISRQTELASLFHCAPEKIRVIYDGVDQADLFSLSAEGRALVERLGLGEADLILLMPVRITQAKNIELALRVVQGLKEKGVRPKMVLTGPPDPHDPQNMSYYKQLLELRHELGVQDEFRFVYESGPEAGTGYRIDLPLVREIYRLCDALFMPSHREGFGMPILEAGLIGMPVFSTDIPATREIGGAEVVRFSADDSADKVAELILSWAQASTTQRLRQRVRQNYTWRAIFRRDILPLLREGEAA